LNVKQVVGCRDELLAFAYYELQKQRNLPEKVQDEVGELSAFPVLTVPYSSILWVELNPGKAHGTQQESGFQTSRK